MGYTLGQFEAYLRASDAKSREQLKLQAYAHAVGSSGGKALAEWIKALS